MGVPSGKSPGLKVGGRIGRKKKASKLRGAALLPPPIQEIGKGKMSIICGTLRWCGS